jgi:hypothetical protein
MSKYKDLGYELGLKHQAVQQAIKDYFPSQDTPAAAQQVVKGVNINNLKINKV